MSFVWTVGDRPSDTWRGRMLETRIQAGVNSDTNYSASDQMYLKYAGATNENTSQQLMRFDLTDLQPYGLTVEDAKVFVYVTDDELFAVNQLTMYRCGRAGWTLAGVTWDDYDGVNPWTGPLVDHERVDQGTPDWIFSSGSDGTEPKWFEWGGNASFVGVVQDVLDGVIEAPAGWLNLIFFGAENKNFLMWGSRYEGNTTLRPYLELTFAGAEPDISGPGPIWSMYFEALRLRRRRDVR